MRRVCKSWQHTLFGLAWLLALALPPPASAQAWEARNGLDEENLRLTTERLKADSYIPSTWNAYRDGKHLRYAGLWEQYEGDWEHRRGLSKAALELVMAKLSSEGYGIVRLEAHTEQGQVRYSGLWLGLGAGDLQGRVAMTSAAYQAEFERQIAAGRDLIHARPYNDRGQLRYLAVFGTLGVQGWQARHDMDPATYQRNFDQMKAAGYLPVEVSGAHADGKVVYAAVWHPNANGVAWKARHGMDTAAYNADFLQSLSDGYQLIHLDVFDVDGKPSFAAIWVK